MMFVACKYGKIEIMNFLNDLTSFSEEHRRIFVCCAAKADHIEIIEYFIERGYSDYEDILSYGYMNFDIIKLMIEKGAKNFDEILNSVVNPKEKEFLLAIKKSFIK